MHYKCVFRFCMPALLLAGTIHVAWAAPVFERVSAPSAAHAGKPFEVVCEVRWRGAADAYMVLPLEYDGADWAEVSLGPSRAFMRDGEHVVTQTVVLTPRKPGSFEVPALRAGYLTPGDLAAVREPGEMSGQQEPERQIPRLHVSGFSVDVRRDVTVLWTAVALVGAGLIIYLSGVGVFLWKRAREGAGEPEAAVKAGPIHGADPRAAGRTLHEAKRCRVEGDFYGFYGHLAKAAELLGPSYLELAGVLQARAQRVGFQGYAPTEDDVASDYRAVARALKQLGDAESPESP